MTRAALALIGLALALSAPAEAAGKAQTHATGPRPRAAPARAPAKRPAARPAPPVPATPPPESVSRVAQWIASAQDNGPLPYIIIDKRTAELFLFDAKGTPRGRAPVLIGLATGDDATPGVGAKTLAQLGPAEKTTPAGRFVARYGIAAGHNRVLWVDYGTSVALHPMPPGTPKERRRARMASPSHEDNRITFGCINLPPAFYAASVTPLFRRKGGVVYILPDTRTLEEVFPRLRLMPYLNQAAGQAAGQAAPAVAK